MELNKWFLIAANKILQKAPEEDVCNTIVLSLKTTCLHIDIHNLISSALFYIHRLYMFLSEYPLHASQVADGRFSRRSAVIVPLTHFRFSKDMPTDKRQHVRCFFSIVLYSYIFLLPDISVGI